MPKAGTYINSDPENCSILKLWPELLAHLSNPCWQSKPQDFSHLSLSFFFFPNSFKFWFKFTAHVSKLQFSATYSISCSSNTKMQLTGNVQTKQADRTKSMLHTQKQASPSTVKALFQRSRNKNGRKV